MKRRTLVLALSMLVGCKGEGSAPPSGSTAAAGSKAAPTQVASSAPSVNEAAKPASAETTFTGAYEAKLGAVRTPEDSPKFDDVTEGALGPGTLTLVLPAEDGEVSGTASGALGASTLHGATSGAVVTAQLRPDSGATPVMWGLLSATIEGTGDARTITGTLRESSDDGHVVREATFTLKKK